MKIRKKLLIFIRCLTFNKSRFSTARSKLAFTTKGFTMVELLVALAIGSIVSVAFYSTFNASQRTFKTQKATVAAQQKIRSVCGLMARDIRMAGLDPLDTDNFGIEVAQDTKITFTKDSIDPVSGDFNGVIDDINLERNGYELIGDELYEVLYEGSVDEISILLVEDVEALNFTYFDAGNNVIATPVAADSLKDIRRVQVSVTLRELNGIDSAIRRSLTRVIECRNLAYN